MTPLDAIRAERAAELQTVLAIAATGDVWAGSLARQLRGRGTPWCRATLRQLEREGLLVGRYEQHQAGARTRVYRAAKQGRETLQEGR